MLWRGRVAIARKAGAIPFDCAKPRPVSTENATGSSVSSTGSNNAVVLQRATISWLPITLPSYSLRQSGSGYAFMSPRPSSEK